MAKHIDWDALKRLRQEKAAKAEKKRNKYAADSSVTPRSEVETDPLFKALAYARERGQEPPKTTVAPRLSMRNSYAAQNRSNTTQPTSKLYDLAIQAANTYTKTIAEDYQKSKVGYDYLSRYNNKTKYSDVQSDIANVKSIRAGAQRRGRDTEVYDRALDMLKDYSTFNRDLADTMTMNEIEKRKASNKAQHKESDEDKRDYTWLAEYNNGDIVAQTREEGEKNKIKAQKLTEYFKKQYGIDDVTFENMPAFSEKTKSKDQISDIAYFDENNDAVTWDSYYRIRSAEKKLNEIQNNKAVSDIYNKNANDSSDLQKIDDAIQLVELSFSDATDTEPLTYSREEKANLEYLANKYNIDFNTPTLESKDALISSLNSIKKQVEDQFNTDKNELKNAGYDFEELEYYKQYTRDKEAYAKRKKENEAFATANAQNLSAASMRTILSAPIKAIEYAGNIIDAAKYAGVDESSAFGLINVYNDYITNTTRDYTGAISQAIKDEVKNVTNSDVLAWLASGAYTGITSGAQSVMTMAVSTAMFGPVAGEAIGLSLLGSEAAADGFNTAVRNGSTNEQAVYTSIAYGINEALFEKMSFDHLMGMSKGLDVSSLSAFLKSLMKSSPDMLVQGLIEADEEVNTDIANTIADDIINGNHNEYYIDVDRYISQGYSRAEAEKRATGDWLSQLLESAYGGFVGGIAAGGGRTLVNTGKATINTGKTAFNKVQGKIEESQYRKQSAEGIAEQGNVQAVIDRAKAISDDTPGAAKIKAQAEKVERMYHDESTSDKKVKKEVGKLFALVQGQNVASMGEKTAQRTEIKRAYTEQLKGTENAEETAEALTKKELGEKLTRKETKLVETKAAQKAQKAVEGNKDVIKEQARETQRQAFNSFVENEALTMAQEEQEEEPIDTTDYKKSADENTYYDGERVNVKDIASVGTDDVTVNLDNGKTANVKNMELPSEDDAILYQSIIDIQRSVGKEISPTLANEIFEGYDKDVYKSAADYVVGVREAIQKGMAGDTTISDTALTPTAREVFYQAGQQIAQSETQAAQRAVEQNVSQTDNRRQGTVTFEDGTQSMETVKLRLSPRQRVAVDIVEQLAKSQGIDIVFFESKKDSKGRWVSSFANTVTQKDGSSPNGFYKNGKIYLDINSGSNGQGLILFTASHELVHLIKQYSPEHYQKLADFLIANYAKKGVSARQLALKQMSQNKKLTYSEALEEVIAQSCESFLRDTHLSEKAAQLYEQDAETANIVLRYLKRFVERLRTWYASLKPQSYEGRFVAAMRDTIEPAYDMFLEGVNAAARNLRNTTATNESTTKMQERDNVIPLSERFDSTKADIRYQDRGDFEVDLFDEDDSIADQFAREYATHHEDIGEVLKNIADIDIAPSKVERIIRKVIRDNFGDIDSETLKTLSVELQMAMEDTAHPEQISQKMIAAVRKAIDGATVTNDEAEENYREFLQAISGTYYLTDEQIADLKEHDMSLNDFRKLMFGKMNIVTKETALKRAGHADARPLSLEGLYDVLDSPEEYLPYSRDQWDEMGYHAPIIIMDTLETLRGRRTTPLSEMASSQDMDDIAVQLAAQFTGEIVEAKYKAKYYGSNNKYDQKNVDRALAQQKKDTDDYIALLVDNLRIQHEQALAEQETKRKEALEKLKAKERERAEKREAKLRDKYREQREKSRESRQRTELRHRIRRLSNSFERRLTKPKGQQYVPRELIAQAVDVLKAINLDTGRSTRLSEKLALLRSKYDALKSNNEHAATYDGNISEMLLRLSEDIGDTSIMKLTSSQLNEIYNILKALDKNIRDAVKMVDSKFKSDCREIGRQIIGETRDVPKPHSGFVSYYAQSMLSAERFFNRIAGFKKDSTWSQIYKMLNDGQLHMTQLQMEFTQLFSELMADTKQLRSLFSTKEKDLVDVGLVDDEGNPVKITRGMMLSLYMHLQNEDNARHVLGGGLTVPGMKTYYKGDLKKAYGQESTRVTVDTEDFSRYVQGLKSRIESELTDYEKAWIKKAHEFFDVASRKALNETTMKLYGFEKANVDNYFPIHTDPTYRKATFEAIVRDMSLENSGFMKDRVKASNPILLEDLLDVITEQISRVSRYCGMTIPIRNFQKVYGTIEFGTKTKSEDIKYNSSVQEILEKKFSATKGTKGANGYIQDLIKDLVVDPVRRSGNTGIDWLVGKVRANTAKAALSISPSVSFAQAASIPTAAAVIGYKPIMKALASKYLTVTDERIAEITPLFWLRRQGYANTELGDIQELRKQKHKIQGKVAKALNWINAMDSFAVRRLFVASEYYVKDNYKNLTPGTEEYNQKLSEVFNKVVESTQPNYTTMQRPDVLRDPSTLKKTLTMFLTQRLQNFNIVYDAVGTYNKYVSDYKSHKNGVTEADLKWARRNLVRAITSQIAAAATIAIFKWLAGVLLHSMSAYKDDDDEVTLESQGLGMLQTFGDTIFGNVIFGSDLYKILMKYVFGKRYYGINMTGVDTIMDVIDAIKDNKFDVYKFAKSLSQCFGLPYNNAEKIAMGIYNHIADAIEGKLFSYESNYKLSDILNFNMDRAAVNKIVSGDYSDMDSLTKNEYQKAYDKAWRSGETADKCKSKGMTAARKAIADKVKYTYITSEDQKTRNAIEEYMFKSGYYVVSSGKNKGEISEGAVKKTVDSWINKQTENERKALTAEARKLNK